MTDRLASVLAAVSGFVTIWLVIGVGWLVAQFRIGTTEHRRFLNRYAFAVASPVLLFGLLARADLHHIFARTMWISALAIVVAGGSYLLYWAVVLRRRQGVSAAIIGCLCAGYTNSGNLGLPIAAFVLGDMTWMAPILVLQVGFIQPLAITLLDVLAARRNGSSWSPWRYLALPFRNPMTIGTFLGIAVNLAGWSVPTLILPALEMVAATAVPAMLVAFGMSLRLDPLPGIGLHWPQLVATSLIKVVIHPLAAFGIGWAAGLAAPELLAVTVLGALPTAQNIFVIAARYRTLELLARDAIFWSTLLTIPTIIVISTFLR